MSQIFISYAREDKAKAELMAEAFSRRGWSVWWDREIPPGKTFDVMIENALNSAHCVIVLWSRASATSCWVKTEAAEGAAREILVPVLIENAQIPLEFKRIEAANLCDWQGDAPHAEFDQLLKTVADILGGSFTDSIEQPRIKGQTQSRRRPKMLPRWTAMAAAILIALSGWIVAIYQSDLLDTGNARILSAHGSTVAFEESAKTVDLADARDKERLSTGRASPYAVSLPNKVDVKFGNLVYKIMNAQIDRENPEKPALRFTIRLMNNGRYDANFWNASFRLLADGVPGAPASELNEVVPGHSAMDAEIVFVIPHGTRSLVLKIWNGDESSEIPLITPES